MTLPNAAFRRKVIICLLLFIGDALHNQWSEIGKHFIF